MIKWRVHVNFGNTKFEYFRNRSRPVFCDLSAGFPISVTMEKHLHFQSITATTHSLIVLRYTCLFIFYWHYAHNTRLSICPNFVTNIVRLAYYFFSSSLAVLSFFTSTHTTCASNQNLGRLLNTKRVIKRHACIFGGKNQNHHRKIIVFNYKLSNVNNFGFLIFLSVEFSLWFVGIIFIFNSDVM